MSTDHQNFSTLNQKAAIAEYAAQRGYEIIQTYADEGKSGLRLEGREALLDLLEDVQTGRAQYKVILVYDISRWGRFQDADEAAFLEYTCKRNGVLILYCIEQFENDGSMTSTVFKGMKRVMAGEYSRELSVKVFRGQCRLIQLGFRQGGPAGYGLRRLLINERREPKGLLAPGEHKSIQTDRVVLVPGPAEEIAIIQKIYKLFLAQGMREGEIARQLNQEGVPADADKPWTGPAVHQILTNEKYIGNNVFNRVSFKLKQRRIRNQPSDWVRLDQAFEALVDRETFLATQQIIARRSRRFSNLEMIELLTQLLLEKGLLSGIIIDEQEDMPSSAMYRHRFGSLARAYNLVGYTPARDVSYCLVNRQIRRMYPEILADIIANIEAVGGMVSRAADGESLRINDEITVAIVISRCISSAAGRLKWRINLETGRRPDLTIVVRLEADNQSIRDYYLLPSRTETRTELKLSEENGIYLDAFQVPHLERFYSLVERTDVRRAA